MPCQDPLGPLTLFSEVNPQPVSAVAQLICLVFLPANRRAGQVW